MYNIDYLRNKLRPDFGRILMNNKFNRPKCAANRQSIAITNPFLNPLCVEWKVKNKK